MASRDDLTQPQRQPADAPPLNSQVPGLPAPEHPAPAGNPPFLAPEPRPWTPRKRKGLAWWHWLVMLGAGPFVILFVMVGAYTCTKWLLGDPLAPFASVAATHKPEAHKTHTPKPQPPAYNLAGYRSAITGPEEKAFAASLWKLRADIKRPDYTAAVNDAPRLMATANAWLSLLRQTNPPPSYGPAKLAYMQAAIVARRAGQATRQALQTADLAGLQRGADQAARARYLLTHAPSSMPTDAPIGSLDV